MSDQQLSQLLEEKGLQDSTASELVIINAHARDRALKTSLAAVGLLGLLGALLSFLLINDRPKSEPERSQPPQ
jgi:hypothetical protein